MSNIQRRVFIPPRYSYVTRMFESEEQNVKNESSRGR